MADSDSDMERDYGGYSSDSSVASNQRDSFTIGNTLTPPEYNLITVNELFERLDAKVINLEPDYQREVVWPKARMSELIASMLQHYYIPPILFHKIDDDDWVCVDGKQRLTSIYKFRLGEIPVRDENDRLWYYIAPTKGVRKISVWSKAQRQEFNSRKLVMAEYENLATEDEEELFARVQQGMSLGEAEKVMGKTGKWQTFVRQLAQNNPLAVKPLKNDRQVWYIAALSAIHQMNEIFSSPARPCFVLGTSTIRKMVRLEQGLNDVSKARARRVFEKIAELVGKYPTTFRNAQYLTFSPIELIGTACLIAIYPDRSDALLKGDIGYYRASLREKHSGRLQRNIACWETTWKIISRKLRRHREAPDFTMIERPLAEREPNEAIPIGESPDLSDAEHYRTPTYPRPPRRSLAGRLRLRDTTGPRSTSSPRSTDSRRSSERNRSASQASRQSGSRASTQSSSRHTRVSQRRSPRRPATLIPSDSLVRSDGEDEFMSFEPGSSSRTLGRKSASIVEESEEE